MHLIYVPASSIRVWLSLRRTEVLGLIFLYWQISSTSASTFWCARRFTQIFSGIEATVSEQSLSSIDQLLLRVLADIFGSMSMKNSWGLEFIFDLLRLWLYILSSFQNSKACLSKLMMLHWSEITIFCLLKPSDTHSLKKMAEWIDPYLRFWNRHKFRILKPVFNAFRRAQHAHLVELADEICVHSFNVMTFLWVIC